MPISLGEQDGLSNLGQLIFVAMKHWRCGLVLVQVRRALRGLRLGKPPQQGLVGGIRAQMRALASHQRRQLQQGASGILREMLSGVARAEQLLIGNLQASIRGNKADTASVRRPRVSCAFRTVLADACIMPSCASCLPTTSNEVVGSGEHARASYDHIKCFRCSLLPPRVARCQ